MSKESNKLENKSEFYDLLEPSQTLDDIIMLDIEGLIWTPYLVWILISITFNFRTC